MAERCREVSEPYRVEFVGRPRDEDAPHARLLSLLLDVVFELGLRLVPAHEVRVALAALLFLPVDTPHGLLGEEPFRYALCRQGLPQRRADAPDVEEHPRATWRLRRELPDLCRTELRDLSPLLGVLGDGQC